MTSAVPDSTRAGQPGHGPGLAALEQQVLVEAPAMFRLAARLMGSAHDADDVLQDAFAKALIEVRRGGLRGDSSLKTWLYRITTNVALDRLRASRARTAAGAPAAEPTSNASPEAVVALRELSEAIGELPDDQRAALVLKEVQGLTTREVAEILERSEGATEQLLVRARQELRRRLEP